MKYRKKPVVIEAFKITEELAIKNLIDKEPLPFGLSGFSGSWHEKNRTVSSAYKGFNTPEGQQIAYMGDWIIKDTAGDCYPCKPDIFELHYESIEELTKEG
jgi:hypothetical protein